MWDIARFDSTNYLAGTKGLYEINGALEFNEVDFVRDHDMKTGFLAGASDCLWSVGAQNIVRFDGTRWDIFWPA
ncbi:MAG: hypothetical protein AAF310_02725 [Myxococcota bacterium]